MAQPRGSERRPQHLHLTRDAIARELGGGEFLQVQTEAGYRAALDSMTAVMPQTVECLRHLASVGLVSASARYDEPFRLLDVLGVQPIPTCAILEDTSWPGVIFVGCSGQIDSDRDDWVRRMLGRGAIIVSSDLNARLPVIGNALTVAPSRPLTRARLEVREDAAAYLLPNSSLSRYLVTVRPAVQLAAGHVPLSIKQPVGTQVLACEGGTREPLIVVASVAGGQLLHSVAHWWQEGVVDNTELGRRSLATVPGFAVLGNQHREARLSQFSAGAAMLACLLIGLDAAFAAARRHVAIPGFMVSNGCD